MGKKENIKSKPVEMQKKLQFTYKPLYKKY